MAGIVPSLFGPTPQELEAQRRQQQTDLQQFYAAQSPQAGTGAAVGTLIGKGLSSLFGTQDPAIERATKVYSILQTVQNDLGQDVNDPNKLYPALSTAFKDAGLSDMASKVTMEGYGKIGDWNKQQAEINKLNEQAKAEVAKANKEKKSPLQIKEEYLAEVRKDYEADPTNSLLKDKLDRATQEVNNEIATKLSSDAQFSQAVATLNNPNATKEEKARAKQVYGMLLPKVTNQGSYITEIDDKGNTVVKPMPGSIEYEKRKTALDKGINLIKSRQTTLNETTSAIDTAITTAKKPLATGFLGKATGWVPGTPGYTLTEGDLKEIKARIGFGELQEMRLNSPTGGALGQVAVQELTYLQNSLGALEPGLGGPKLIENLEKVKKHYEGFLKALDDELKAAQTKQANLTPAPKESLATPSTESAPASTGGSDYLSIIRNAKKNKEQ